MLPRRRLGPHHALLRVARPATAGHPAGRQLFFGEQHLARLRLIRTLQSHGRTLGAIEAYLQRIPQWATPEHLGVQRSILSSWAPELVTPVTTDELARRAGRTLDDQDVVLMERTGVLQRTDDGFVVRPGFEVTLEMFDMDVPAEAIVKGAHAIDEHLSRLADDLEDIMRDHVLRPLRDGRGPAPSEEVLLRLSALTTATSAAPPTLDTTVIGAGPVAGAANVVMQLARPGVGYGVYESRVESGRLHDHPIKRTRTTLTYLAVATSAPTRNGTTTARPSTAPTRRSARPTTAA
jgi:DNA-binding transcriptional MerR regulator